MATIFGREGELLRIARLFDSSLQHGVARAVRVQGPSGVGKTALTRAAVEDAGSKGWVMAAAQCFRIQSSLPLFIARRLARALVESLGDGAQRYQSGLDLTAEAPERFEEAFLRLVEGVTIDFPVAFSVDDAQWADDRSCELIARTLRVLADRRIVLLSTERSDEANEPAFAIVDETIAIGDLSHAAAESVVRSVFPDANDDVVASIVENAGGRAMDLVAVAEAARDAEASTSKAAAASTRTVIARDLALLDQPLRTFLQVCALIDEPIDFALLRTMWEPNVLLDFIASASGRYLREDGGELRFVHSAIMEAVHETIPIEIPLRYRIIDALKRLPSPRLEDLERLAQQAAATREAELERETLLALARAAAAKSLQTLAAQAMERALAIRDPGPDEIVPFFTQLSQLYNVLGRERDCVRVCRDALALARDGNITEGLASVVSSLILGLWHAGNYAVAREEYERYRNILTSDSDRALMESARAFMSMHAGEFDEVERAHREFEALGDAAHPIVHLRQRTVEAFAALRLGDEVHALENAAAAERIAERLPAITMTMPRNVRLLHAVQYLGATTVEQLLAARHNELSETFADVLLPVIHLGKGEFSDLFEFTAERVARGKHDAMARRLLIAPYAVAAAIDKNHASHALWSVLAEEVAHFHSGTRATPLLPPVAAWLATSGTGAGSGARKILDELIALYARPFDNVVFSYPFLLVLAAQRLEARDALQHLAEGNVWTDKHPLATAHDMLARGSALVALKDSRATAVLASARDIFDRLRMPFFAAYAASVSGSSAKPTAAAVPNKTTRREREVAALVADGRTNKEIAQELVLSERTVEGHIANLFAKVNVSSRTQLAAWYLKTISSVA